MGTNIENKFNDSEIKSNIKNTLIGKKRDEIIEAKEIYLKIKKINIKKVSFRHS